MGTTTLLYRYVHNRKLDTEVNQRSKYSGFWISLGGVVKSKKTNIEKRKHLIQTYYKESTKELFSGINLTDYGIDQTIF
jgi:hypothetical protein